MERAGEWVRGTPLARLDQASVQQAQEAVDLYRGPLFDGWYEDWCLQERERLQGLYLLLLQKLMGYWQSRANSDAAIGYGERILRADPANEWAHRELMRLHALLGDRTSALRQYDRCVAALARDLSVKPSEETRRLYETVRDGESSEKLLPDYSLVMETARSTLERVQSLSRLLSDVDRDLQERLGELNTALSRQPR